MVAPNPLSEQDLVAARAALSAGKPFTVWFTPAAVGVPADGSAKVISIADAAEGDFIQVRPAGMRDTMFCSPSELTSVRPKRKRVQPPAERALDRIPAQGPGGGERRRDIGPASEQPRAAQPLHGMAQPPVPAPAPVPAPEKSPGRPRSGNGRSVGQSAEVTVTLCATTEGEWTVEVMVGKKRTVRPTPVQPAEVAKAARSLPSAVGQAIEASLAAARQRQLDRVERLRAELEVAQRALQELSS